jgi:hypothetical protein
VAIGVMLMMRELTKAMRQAAASGGSYLAPNKKPFPKIQLLTAGELLGGKRIEMPMWEAVQTFKPVARVKGKKQETPSLPLDGEG